MQLRDIIGEITFFKLEALLRFEFLTTYEAAIMLTGRPPNEKLYQVEIDGLPDAIKNLRLWFISPHRAFSAKDYSENFQVVYRKIKAAVEGGGLSPISIPLFDEFRDLIKTRSVLKWALKNGIQLPKPIEEATKIYLFVPKGQKDALNRKIRNKIIGQYVLAKDAKMSLVNIANDDLMMKLGTSGELVSIFEIERVLDQTSCTEESDGEWVLIPSKLGEFKPTIIEQRVKVSREKVLENLINELRPLGKNYIPKAIPEIKRARGIEYHVPSLIVGMRAAASVKIYLMLEHNPEQNFEGFLYDFNNDPIVKLYLEGAHAFIREIVDEEITFYCKGIFEQKR